MLHEHDETTLAVAVDNFSRDRNPNREIRCWEVIARIYAEELAERPSADATERALLFRAVFACSFSTRPEDILSSQPQLKGFPGLARIIQRCDKRLAGCSGKLHHKYRSSSRESLG